MQQLKAVNCIFCDWQFASLKSIFIPVLPGDESALNNSDFQIVTRQEMLSFQKLIRTASDNQIAKDVPSSDNNSVKDYFSKYDASLAEIKGSMDQLEQSLRQVIFFM